MGIAEKIYVVLFLLAFFTRVVVAIVLGVTGSPLADAAVFDVINVVGKGLALVFYVVLIRDLYKREFADPNGALTWALLLILLWPSVFVYLARHGFRPRLAVVDETAAGTAPA